MIVWSALHYTGSAWLGLAYYLCMWQCAEGRVKMANAYSMCTHRLFAFDATLCETYYGLVTHVYRMYIHPTPLWQRDISEQLHKCALECAQLESKVVIVKAQRVERARERESEEEAKKE